MWITVEGINGVGKTYLINRAAARLGRRCRIISELTDTRGRSLPTMVIAAMAGYGGTFLRTGHPITEMLALLALKVYEYEHARVTGPAGDIVLEDRGVDTVAVYQCRTSRN